MLTIYGLKTCDTCRKAAKALEAAGHQVGFRDIRSEPMGEAKLAELLGLFGDKLVNTRSTTWRSLTAEQQRLPALRLLAEHPALMKRPVIDYGGQVTLGWDKAVQRQYLG